MEAARVDFLDFLGTNYAQFRIPPRQRRYKWGKKAIERLVKDLKYIASHAKNHNGGSLITFQEPKVVGPKMSYYQVIDGQQRLVPASMILARIGFKLGEKGKVGQKKKFDQIMIRSQFLLNSDVAPQDETRLQLQKEDNREYKQILKNEYHPSGSNI